MAQVFARVTARHFAPDPLLSLLARSILWVAIFTRFYLLGVLVYELSSFHLHEPRVAPDEPRAAPVKACSFILSGCSLPP
jgi:hypothetical protein